MLWRFLLILAVVTSSHAQWSTDPTNNLIVGFGLNPEIASDNAGGCYITYTQQVGIYDRIILERLNRYGYKPWGASRQVLGVLPGQSFAKITEDCCGGVIVSFMDVEVVSPKEPPIERLRVQRVDSSGNSLWGPTGVRVSLSETNQGDHAIVTDGAGGCIVAWVDTLGDLRINRINNQGVRMWGDIGEYVWNSPAAPLMACDGRNGCILGFGVGRVQRIDLAGIPLWGPSGVLLENIGIADLSSDGSGGVITAGMKFISYNNGDPFWAAKAQRVDSLGQILWGNDGLMLEDSLHGLFLNPPRIALTKNANGSVTIAWGRRISPGNLGLQTQIVRSDGNTIFPFGGHPVNPTLSGKTLVGVLPSDSMSSLFVWFDNRTPSGVYAQRLDTLGSAKWDTDDIALCLISLGGLKVATDTYGGCILAGWRESDFTVRVQQVNKNGMLGQVITSINTPGSTSLPNKLMLLQNYPNPFNSSTTIFCQLPHSGDVRMTIYNLLGQRVTTLFMGMQEAGGKSILFDATNLSSGIYLYKLETQYESATSKFIIIK